MYECEGKGNSKKNSDSFNIQKITNEEVDSSVF